MARCGALVVLLGPYCTDVAKMCSWLLTGRVIVEIVLPAVIGMDVEYRLT